ncbi:uncharacterized protein [Penaeus vannamei]|uniref:uncharacterized protein isoform X1 n=1 Tax=Penaeus vannamei TaxID=6689 RepID=UPI000F687F59|nr:uncharacterized protein LOC113823109 isoform X1 [Penaeus vannamei]
MDYRSLEKLLTCPYNPSHQILPHRMAQHLVKCKKSHPEADMKVCVFNATHVVPTHLYQVHILECPDKAIVERDIYRRREVENKLQAKRQAPRPMIPTHAVCTEEDWDSETVASSYNPTEHIIHREIARPPPPGLGKAGRRQWREVELERIRRLKAGEPIDDLVYPGKPEEQMIGSQLKIPSADTLSHSQSFSRIMSSTSSLVMQSDQPLRRPKIELEPHSRIAANIFHNGSCSSVNSEPKTEEMQAKIEELKKQESKIKSKLKQMKKLEGKKAGGGQLTSEEEAKIAKRSEFEAQLAEVKGKMEELIL